MKPIINPIYFYLMTVLDNLIFVLGILIFCVIAFIIVYAINSFVEDKFEERKGILFNATKIIAFLLALSIFIPNSDTIVKMMVADNITYARVEEAGNVVQEVYEDIIELFEDEE